MPRNTQTQQKRKDIDRRLDDIQKRVFKAWEKQYAEVQKEIAHLEKAPRPKTSRQRKGRATTVIARDEEPITNDRL